MLFICESPFLNNDGWWYTYVIGAYCPKMTGKAEARDGGTRTEQRRPHGVASRERNRDSAW